MLCFTIVGIPFGYQCIKLSLLALVPFGKEIRNGERASGCLSTLMNIIWIFVGGIWIALTHLIFALLCAISIIGLPFAKQHMKLASLSPHPLRQINSLSKRGGAQPNLYFNIVVES